MHPINLPPPVVWWAKHETQWYDDSVSVVDRPTEDSAFLKLLLRHWAVHDGNYWQLLTEHEALLHHLDQWMHLFLPQYDTPRARARWVQQHVFSHMSIEAIITQWEIIDAVLCDYAYHQLSLLGLLDEVLLARQPSDGEGQTEAEGTAPPNLTLHQHLSAVLLDDGLDDG